MPKEAFNTEGAMAVGTYSLAVASGELGFFSDKTPLNASTGKLVTGNIVAQTEQCSTPYLRC